MISTDSRCAAHVRALEYYRTVPTIFVPDSLRVDVTRADRCEPDLQRPYVEMTAHHQAVIIQGRFASGASSGSMQLNSRRKSREHYPEGSPVMCGKSGEAIARLCYTRYSAETFRSRLLMIGAQEALARLRAGNERFVSEALGSEAITTPSRRRQVAVAQEPFAILLGCSDSRVPAEIIFDQGLGDLFVIRVAGNIVAPSQIDSVEFAADRYRTRLVVVLGHSTCGAILATLEELARPASEQSRNLRSIVDRVRPSIEPLLATEVAHDHAALVRHAVRANIRASVNQLRRGSRLLEQLIRSDGLLVVGAEYSLESGVVDFFEV